MANTILLFVTVCALVHCGLSLSSWPVPYQRTANRPTSPQFCNAQYKFCPTGVNISSISFYSNDTFDVYALKAPIWEFKFGKLLEYFNFMHDAIGFTNIRTGQNFTVEWYELFELGNSTFPHILPKEELLWCNQGATCLYEGIDDQHWRQNGTLVKVANMTGKQMTSFLQWMKWDNNTAPFYETWTVADYTGKMWFDSFDCASFVLRAFKQLGVYKVEFNKSIPLNYTRATIFSDQPIPLGNITYIKTNNASLYGDLVRFYSVFQLPSSAGNLLDQLVKAADYLMVKKQFYLYYNSLYWLLNLQSPYIHVSFNRVPLP